MDHNQFDAVQQKLHVQEQIAETYPRDLIPQGTKPFILRKALSGDPIITRDGNPVTEIHFFSQYEGDYPVVAIINGRILGFFTMDGSPKLKSHVFPGLVDPLDLFMAPKKEERWMNLYKDQWGEIVFSPLLYRSEEEAKEAASPANLSNKHTVKVWDEIL